jgi:hypothetical protein
MRKPYKIPKGKAAEILGKALALSRNVKVDQLDCSVSVRRQPTDKTILEVLTLGLENSSFYHFIHREGMNWLDEEEYYDVGLSTCGLTPDYFLWIKLSIEQGNKLIQDYNLDEQFPS